MFTLMKHISKTGKNEVQWCNFKGEPSCPTTTEPTPLNVIEEVASGARKASLSDVHFRNPSCFVAGEIHRHFTIWEKVLEGFHKKEVILQYIANGVDVRSFFHHFKGDFKGKAYDSAIPPPSFFENNKICNEFEQFISDTIEERVRNGSLSFWGKRGQCEPPHLVMPITIEPSKPRMCHDERFLNLWMKTPHVTFDHITDLPRYVEPGHYQTKLDDKSGYDHILLSENSKTFFGLCWKDHIFVYNTLPFGWSPSAYIYHTTGLGASHFIRLKGVPLSQYIDDRHIGQLRPLYPSLCKDWSDLDFANAAIYIAAVVLTACGYFLGLQKSVFEPTKAIQFLGFISDSEKQAFILPEDKREKFATLRDNLLSSNVIQVKMLQRFAGKAVSLALAIPAAKLYVREVNAHIGRALRRSKPIRMSKELEEELLSWKFLDDWDGFLPWRQEKHKSIRVTSDASNTGWGGILLSSDNPQETRDYWCADDLKSPIAVKEAKAILNTLLVFSKEVYNCRVDAYVDNTNLVNVWNNEGGRSMPLTNVIKELFELSLKLNISLKLQYIPSHQNLADQPSRVLSDMDCSLSVNAWSRVESAFGPHTVDLMAIPSNVQRMKSGQILPFFSPYPCQESMGVNVFSQHLSDDENYYVFPPFALIGPLMRYLKQRGVRITLIAPEMSPTKYWWPILNSVCICRMLIGLKNERNILNFPPTRNLPWHSKPLPWNLYAFRFLF